MYLDYDGVYVINTLMRIYRDFGDKALIRETEYGYHVYVPVDCTLDNFIYCLVLRRIYKDDRTRISMDIIRLGFFDFYSSFDVVFDEKIKNQNGIIHKIKGKWYNLRDYLALRGII